MTDSIEHYCRDCAHFVPRPQDRDQQWGGSGICCSHGGDCYDPTTHADSTCGWNHPEKHFVPLLRKAPWPSLPPVDMWSNAPVSNETVLVAVSNLIRAQRARASVDEEEANALNEILEDISIFRANKAGKTSL